MADKKAILVITDGMKLTDSGEVMDKLRKKAAILSDADTAGLPDKAVALGGVQSDMANLAATLEKNVLAVTKGKVEAVARKGGRIVARHQIETTGEAVGLKVEPLIKDWKADGKDLQFVRVTAVDSRGRRVWTASDEVNISVEGPARLIAVESGDITSDELPGDSSVRLFHGTAIAILRSGAGSGPVTLQVSSRGIKKGVKSIL